MRKTTVAILLLAVLATGCTRKSTPAPDKYAGFSPEARALAEDFDRSHAELKADLDRMNAEMDAIMPALDEVTAQLMAENDRLVAKLGR